MCTETLTDQYKEPILCSGWQLLDREQQNDDDLFLLRSYGLRNLEILLEQESQLMEWRHLDSIKLNKINPGTYSSRKMIATVFWNENRVILVNFM